MVDRCFPIAFPLAVYVARRIVRHGESAMVSGAPNCVSHLRVLHVAPLQLLDVDDAAGLSPMPPVGVYFLRRGFVICDSEKFHSDYRLAYAGCRGPGWLTVCGLLVTLLSRPFRINGAPAETELLRDVLALTEPGDFVFDCKGETIFRQRCFRPKFWNRKGHEAAPASTGGGRRRATMRRNADCLAAPNGRMPWQACDFISKNCYR